MMLAALALAAPISLGQYRKVKVLSLANNPRGQGQHQPGQEQVDADRGGAQGGPEPRQHDELPNVGRELTHDGKDRILNAAQSTKQAAEWLRDSEMPWSNRSSRTLRWRGASRLRTLRTALE